MRHVTPTCGRLSQILVLSLLVVLLAASVAPKAQAQIFQFTWSGTTTAGGSVGANQSIVISVLIHATSIGPNQYSVDSFSNGTVTDNTADAIDLSGTINNTPSTANFINNGVRNEFFTSGGSAGVSGYFRNHTEAPTGFGGFRLASTSGHEYMIWGFSNMSASQDRVSRLIGTNLSPERTDIFTAGPNQFSITQVPGPLAGAGMLSYLAALLMGLLWFRQAQRQRVAVGSAEVETEAKGDRLWRQVRIIIARLRHAPA